jgi:flagellar biosynthesis protein FliR
MITVNLDAQLSGHVFPFLLVFTRLGAAIMLFPGFGESYVPARTRGLFALGLSLLLLPVLMPRLPPVPSGIPDLVYLLTVEALIGVFFGSLLRVLMGALETTGSIVGMQMGLSNAMILNPSMATQSALPSAFLGSAGVVLLFITGLDHLLLRGLLGLYDLFPAGGKFQTGDMAQAYVQMFGKSFLVGVEIAAPFIIAGLLMFVALGFMQRMVQQVQLFLVALPLQILGSLLLFAGTVGVMMSVWLRFFDESIAGYIHG